MTAPLDEKGHDPKLVAALRKLVARLEATPEELRGPFLVKGLKPYLAASPSPSMEMEVDEFVRRLRDFEQAYNTEFFTPLTEAEKARVGGELRSRIAADMGRHLAKFLVQAADRIETAQTQVLRLTEEKQALRADSDQYKDAGHTYYARALKAEARIKALEEALTKIITIDRREKRTCVDFDPAGSTYEIEDVDGPAATVARSALKENAL